MISALERSIAKYLFKNFTFDITNNWLCSHTSSSIGRLYKNELICDDPLSSRQKI